MLILLFYCYCLSCCVCFILFFFVFALIAKRLGSEEAVTEDYIRNNRWLHFDEQYKQGFNFSLKLHHLYILKHLISDYLPFQLKFNKTKYLSIEQEFRNINKSEINSTMVECKQYLSTQTDKSLFEQWFTDDEIKNWGKSAKSDVTITTHNNNKKKNNNKSNKNSNKNKSHQQRSSSKSSKNKKTNQNNNKSKSTSKKPSFVIFIFLCCYVSVLFLI